MILMLRLLLLFALSILSVQAWSHVPATSLIYSYDAVGYLAIDRDIEFEAQNQEYNDVPTFHYCCSDSLSIDLQEKIRVGPFFALSEIFIVTKSPLARGRAAEQRVLNDLGLSKNTQKVRTSEGASIPDALTKRQSIEIKDCISVSCNRKIRIQTEAARNSGRTPVLITGSKTRVSGPARRRFGEENIIRRPDLGPQ